MNYLDEVAQEIKSQLSAADIPEEESSDLFRIYAVLLLAKRSEITNKDVHNAWVAWMLSRGQKHASMVPFSSLPKAVQNEDSPYVKAIRKVAKHVH